MPSVLMTGARFVHDQLELHGWEVEITDAVKVKGLAPLACKTDRIDAWVLAELSRRQLVPAIWLPDPEVRAERERARFRLHLARHRASLKQRVHATLLTHGTPCPVSDLFGVRGRELLARLSLPEPWASDVEASLRLVDELEREIDACEAELRRLGADHRYVPLLTTVPGVAWVLAYTIAAEIGDIVRFPSPRKLAGYSGLCPRVYQSGDSDRRGPLSKNGPRYLRWALIEATTHASHHPASRDRYQRTKTRLGKQRGPKVAQVDLARRLAEAIWHMLTVAPGLARDVTAKVASELADDLRALDSGVEWKTELAVDRLVAPPAQTTEILGAARRKLLDENWDLAIVVTDLPLRVGRRPISRQVSPTHGIAVVSLPALGTLHLTHRLRRTLVELVGELVGDGRGQWNGDGALARLKRRWGRSVLQELATDTADRPGALRFLFVPEVLASHLRLLLGMVRANRPWRLAARLYRALLAAVVAGAYGLVTSDIWLISATAGSTRLALTSIIAVSFTTGAVIVAHGLWERAPARHLRDQVVLFNFATAATVLIGIATLYAALFLMILAAAALLLSPHALGSGLGHAVGTGDYVTLAWFTASLATVGGALGAALESDKAVREAAYAGDTDEGKE